MTPSGSKKVFDEIYKQFETLTPWKKQDADQFLGCSGPLDIYEGSRLLAENHVEETVKQLTSAEEKAYVKTRWMRPHWGSNDHGWTVQNFVGAMTVLATNIKPRYKATHAAYLFTKQREAEIAQRCEDAKFLQMFIDTTAKGKCLQSLHSIIAREQAALAELRRGWKFVKEGGQ